MDDKTIVGSPYVYQHSTEIDNQQIKIEYLFLVSAIVGENESVPIIITKDATFGMSFFNNWKTENGFAEYIAKIEKIPFIINLTEDKKQINLLIDKLKERSIKR